MSKVDIDELKAKAWEGLERIRRGEMTKEEMDKFNQDIENDLRALAESYGVGLEDLEGGEAEDGND